MPRRASQSSSPLVQTASGNPLPAPTGTSIHALTLGTDAPGNYDWTGVAGRAFRVLRAWFQKSDGAGGAGDTVTLATAGGVAISNNMSINMVAGAIVEASSIDPATMGIAAGGGLRAVVVDGNAGATDLRGVLYVEIAHTS